MTDERSTPHDLLDFQRAAARVPGRSTAPLRDPPAAARTPGVPRTGRPHQNQDSACVKPTGSGKPPAPTSSTTVAPRSTSFTRTRNCGRPTCSAHRRCCASQPAGRSRCTTCPLCPWCTAQGVAGIRRVTEDTGNETTKNATIGGPGGVQSKPGPAALVAPAAGTAGLGGGRNPALHLSDSARDTHRPAPTNTSQHRLVPRRPALRPGGIGQPRRRSLHRAGHVPHRPRSQPPTWR